MRLLFFLVFRGLVFWGKGMKKWGGGGGMGVGRMGKAKGKGKGVRTGMSSSPSASWR